MPADEPRVERDSMGEVRVPQSAYYGASTERARQNFPISDLRLPRRFTRALAQIKGAAAVVNAELGLLEARLANAIEQASQDVEEGRFDRDFVVDVFQTGSGTSTNTNANEVIANRANGLAARLARGSRCTRTTTSIAASRVTTSSPPPCNCRHPSPSQKNSSQPSPCSKMPSGERARR
jgi:fumarate hydratase, class II